jgi:methylated-DNA-protein-cysteine methyltransferase-like protein
MSKFKEQVIKVVNLIPYGKVASYGQIALYVGAPRAARQVGWILNQLESKTPVPWWRVVNNEGRISIKASRYTAHDQKILLEDEGVKVDSDFTFDIESYRFRPNAFFIKNLELDSIYLQKILENLEFQKSKRRN